MVEETVDDDTEFVILASDGLWKVGVDLMKVFMEH